MIIQAMRLGSGSGGGGFSFIYTGAYTDTTDENGTRKIRFTSSGTLVVKSGTAKVQAYILGGGGGAVHQYRTDNDSKVAASGGGGGQQTIEIELTPGTYEITIGAGGARASTHYNDPATASAGGSTTAFGYTSTGGKGGYVSNGFFTQTAGAGGTPNGNAGEATTFSSATINLAGGAPNGGDVVNSSSQDGGDGYVEITFS